MVLIIVRINWGTVWMEVVLELGLVVFNVFSFKKVGWRNKSTSLPISQSDQTILQWWKPKFEIKKISCMCL